MFTQLIAAANAAATTAAAAATPAPAAAAPAAVEGAEKAQSAADKLGFVHMLEEGGLITWAIFIVMVIMSTVSLYIIFTKLFEQNKIMKENRVDVAKFWTSSSVKDGAAKLGKNSAYRQIVDDGLRAEEQHGHLKDPIDQHEWMITSLNRSQQAVTSKLGSGLPFLATVGSTAPFVGLLGTVIGILDALIKIAQSGDASIDKVAGPVGEALIMTAIGLIVAVPAVMGYNWLQRRNKIIGEQLAGFASDLHSFMGSGGAVKPVTRSVAPAAAAKPAAAKA
jgi:biopolymer transport protein ExbB